MVNVIILNIAKSFYRVEPMVKLTVPMPLYPFLSENGSLIYDQGVNAINFLTCGEGCIIKELERTVGIESVLLMLFGMD